MQAVVPPATALVLKSLRVIDLHRRIFQGSQFFVENKTKKHKNQVHCKGKFTM